MVSGFCFSLLRINFNIIFNLCFQVHENGLISFGSTLRDQTPAAFPLTNKAYAAAPYWADVNTERGGRIWYRQTNDVMIISRATRNVIRAFPPYTRFMATWVVIVTWDEVTFFGASGSHRQNVSYGNEILAKVLQSNMQFMEGFKHLELRYSYRYPIL